MSECSINMCVETIADNNLIKHSGEYGPSTRFTTQIRMNISQNTLRWHRRRYRAFLHDILRSTIFIICMETRFPKPKESVRNVGFYSIYLTKHNSICTETKKCDYYSHFFHLNTHGIKNYK